LQRFGGRIVLLLPSLLVLMLAAHEHEPPDVGLVGSAAHSISQRCILYPQAITRVFLNLISNGFYAAAKRRIDAACRGPEPTLGASAKSLGSKVEIRIRDNDTRPPR
jgi:signal transduction histidine kinase